MFNVYHILDANSHLQYVQSCIEIKGFSKALFNKKLAMNSVLDYMLHNQDLMLWDQCRVKWLRDGVKNYNLFHSLLLVRRTIKPMSSLFMVNSDLSMDSEVINNMILLYSEFYFRMLLKRFLIFLWSQKSFLNWFLRMKMVFLL